MNYITTLLKSKGIFYTLRINSLIWKWILQFLGCSVGSNFYIEGRIRLKLRASSVGLTIGDNVRIFGDVDFRTRERGSITIRSNVILDDQIRIVAAQNANILIDSNTQIGCRSIINAGESVFIGKNVLIGPNCIIQASNHGISLGTSIINQSYTHEPINIQEDCWLSANVVILPGVSLHNGSVIGAGAVVTKDTTANSISVGIPAKELRMRS